jgi:hypothetical protein
MNKRMYLLPFLFLFWGKVGIFYGDKFFFYEFYISKTKLKDKVIDSY